MWWNVGNERKGWENNSDSELVFLDLTLLLKHLERLIYWGNSRMQFLLLSIFLGEWLHLQMIIRVPVPRDFPHSKHTYEGSMATTLRRRSRNRRWHCCAAIGSAAESRCLATKETNYGRLLPSFLPWHQKGKSKQQFRCAIQTSQEKYMRWTFNQPSIIYRGNLYRLSMNFHYSFH